MNENVLLIFIFSILLLQLAEMTHNTQQGGWVRCNLYYTRTHRWPYLLSFAAVALIYQQMVVLMQLYQSFLLAAVLVIQTFACILRIWIHNFVKLKLLSGGGGAADDELGYVEFKALCCIQVVVKLRCGGPEDENVIHHYNCPLEALQHNAHQLIRIQALKWSQTAGVLDRFWPWEWLFEKSVMNLQVLLISCTLYSTAVSIANA